MGARPPISLAETGSSFSSPGGSMYSPSETESSVTSSSISLPDSSSPSLTHCDSTYAIALTLPPQHPSRQEIIIPHNKKASAKGNIVVAGLRQKDAVDLRHSPECTYRNPLRGHKRAMMGSCKSRDVRMSMRKTCCRCAGAFAADCAALSCCPCAIISLLALVLVEIPSALATRMITHLKKRLFVRDAQATCGDRHGDESHRTISPMRSQENCKGAGEAEAVHIIRFDTENLLKHFDAEHVGFGCLSQKRE